MLSNCIPALRSTTTKKEYRITAYLNQRVITSIKVTNNKDLGTPKYMLIYSETRSTEYHGQVTETEPYIPHGEGMLRSKKDGFVYNGYFMEGKYHGHG